MGVASLFLTLRDQAIFLKSLPPYAAASYATILMTRGRISIPSVRGMPITTLLELFNNYRIARQGENASKPADYVNASYLLPASSAASLVAVLPTSLLVSYEWQRVADHLSASFASAAIMLSLIGAVCLSLYFVCVWVLKLIRGHRLRG